MDKSLATSQTGPTPHDCPAPLPALAAVTSTVTGAQMLWAVLVEQGVEVVFGYPGGAIMPAYDALPGYPIEHVLVRHEQSAAHMADGYARASGRVGVAIATSGPGATNLVTGIATAKLDSIPMVCITGQVASDLLGTDAFQEIDIISITRPITKHNFLVRRAEDIAPALREAFRIAKSGRPGPVLVDITKDAQQARLPAPIPSEPSAGCVSARHAREQVSLDDSPSTGTIRATETAHGKNAMSEALGLLARARRPLILAGHGVIVSEASAELLELVTRTNIPVACTLLGLGAVPGTHPQNLGMMGMHGEAWVNEAIQRADLLIAIGMRFDDRVTGDLKTYAQSAKKIHIELDPAEINKNVKVDVALIGDARAVLRELLTHELPPGFAPWNDEIRALRGESAVRDIQGLPDDGHLYAAHVIHDLWRLTGGEAIVVTDVGQHQMWEAQYWKHDRPRTLITSGGLGTMGFALPAAIGARFAQRTSEIWVIAGDGGFQMTAAELTTIAQEQIKLNIAIINNGYLGMVRQWQQMFYQGRYVATPMKSPDFVALARAHGLDGLRVTRRSDVDAAVEQARRASGTVLLEFCVEQQDMVYPMVPSGADLRDMIRRPAPRSPLVETADDR